MTDPVIDSVSAGTQQMVQDAQRLGLTWNLRRATVVTSTTDQLTILLDGDTLPVNATSTMGPLAAGMRVTATLIPPSGVFVTGFADTATSRNLGITKNTAAASASGSTSSATYVNMPGLPFVSLVKLWPATATAILVWFGTSCFSSAAPTGVSFALNTHGGTGTNVEIFTAFFNVANSHQAASGSKLLTGLDADSYDLSGAWRRYTGAGTLQMNADDWVSITAQEVWIV